MKSAEMWLLGVTGQPYAHYCVCSTCDHVPNVLHLVAPPVGGALSSIASATAAAVRVAHLLRPRLQSHK